MSTATNQEIKDFETLVRANILVCIRKKKTVEDCVKSVIRYHTRLVTEARVDEVQQARALALIGDEHKLNDYTAERLATHPARRKRMKLFRRLMFAFKYDIDPEFLVYSIPDQHAIRFLRYEDAKEFSDNQIQYRPKIMVAVRQQERSEK